MAQTELPAWLDAATAAAVRLAAEAGAEVDDVHEHGETSPDRLAARIARLEESAELTEVATDLAALLWADCEEVPLIATILEEPGARAALEAVAQARRQAAQRLLADALVVHQRGDDVARADQSRDHEPRVAPASEAREPPATVMQEALPKEAPAPLPVDSTPAAPSAAPAPQPAGTGARRPARAILAGAAAAVIIVFGRRLRRA